MIARPSIPLVVLCRFTQCRASSTLFRIRRIFGRSDYGDQGQPGGVSAIACGLPGREDRSDTHKIDLPICAKHGDAAGNGARSEGDRGGHLL